MRTEVKIFRNLLAEHIKFLPGSLKRSKFQVVRGEIFFAEHITFSQEQTLREHNLAYASRWLLS